MTTIQGTYGFVYCGANGLGVGVFTVTGDRLQGVDYVGGKYDGTVKENGDGSISVVVDFTVMPGAMLVQGTAPQDIPYQRRIEQTMPPLFGDGRPVELHSPPGFVTLMIKRIPDDFASAVTDGLSVTIGANRRIV